jgi:hypothetical protein
MTKQPKQQPVLAELVSIPQRSPALLLELGSKVRKTRIALEKLETPHNPGAMPRYKAKKRRLTWLLEWWKGQEKNVRELELEAITFENNIAAIVKRHFPAASDPAALKLSVVEAVTIRKTAKLRELADRTGLVVQVLRPSVLDPTTFEEIEPGIAVTVSRADCARAAKLDELAGDHEQAASWRRCARKKGRPPKHSDFYCTEFLRKIYYTAHKGSNRPRGSGSKFRGFVKDFWRTFCPGEKFPTMRFTQDFGAKSPMRAKTGKQQKMPPGEAFSLIQTPNEHR